METSELRNKETKDLQAELQDLLRELFNLRMKKRSGENTKTHQFKQLRRNIARIRTILREKVE